MLARRFPESASRVVALFAIAAVLGLTSGCSTTKSVYADEQIRPYLRSLAVRPDYPLARTMTWKYHYTSGKGSYESTWFVADGRLVTSAAALAGVQMYAAQPSTSGVRMSEVYSQRAREAATRGQHAQATLYRGLSDTSLQTQIAAERVAVGMALGGAIQNLGASLLDATIISGSQNAATYVKDDRPPVISDRAPEGTVLELFFRAQKLDGADAKPATVNMRWSTVATLKDAEGRIWRSSASFMTYILYSDPKSTPPEFGRGNYVLMDEGWFVPAADDREAYAAEVQEIGKIGRRGGYIELGVTAARAIEDIYAQIELAKRRGR